jgi:hypothetical protein
MVISGNARDPCWYAGPVLLLRGYVSVFCEELRYSHPEVTTVKLYIRVLYVFFVCFG